MNRLYNIAETQSALKSKISRRFSISRKGEKNNQPRSGETIKQFAERQKTITLLPNPITSRFEILPNIDPKSQNQINQ